MFKICAKITQIMCKEIHTSQANWKGVSSLLKFHISLLHNIKFSIFQIGISVKIYSNTQSCIFQLSYSQMFLYFSSSLYLVGSYNY